MTPPIAARHQLQPRNRPSAHLPPPTKPHRQPAPLCPAFTPRIAGSPHRLVIHRASSFPRGRTNSLWAALLYWKARCASLYPTGRPGWPSTSASFIRPKPLPSIFLLSSFSFAGGAGRDLRGYLWLHGGRPTGLLRMGMAELTF